MLDTGSHHPITSVAGDARSVADMFLRRVAADGRRNAWFEKTGGRWVGVSYDRWADLSARMAGGLVRLGVEPGDRVAILGPTQAPWAVHDIGAHLAGAVSMGIYPKQSVEQVRYLLEHSEAKVVTVADEAELRTVLAAIDGLDSVVAVVPWREELMALGDDPRLTAPSVFAGEPIDRAERDRRLGAITPDDTAIFVYTSGTTGPPKCAMITHGNILWLCHSISGYMPVYTDDISLSFLPMAHVAERIMAFYNRINCGFATAFATNFAAVLTELTEVRPTVFGSVPRLFEKAYGRVLTELERKPPVVRRLFHWAVGVGRARAHRQIAGQPVSLALRVQHAIADRVVLSKVRAAFGGRIRFVLTGAAPTPRDVLEFFWAAGLPLYEVYGQTEGTVVSHGNIEGQVRLGTVGRCYDGLQCRIADDGEVLIKGPTVFKGYYKNPEATARTIVDGWLHTGDIGQLDADGYLKITDRKKHIIITAGGKNLTPANIQSAIKSADPLIGGVHAHGDRRPYISALIAPSPIETLMFGRDRGLVTSAELEARTAELMDNPSGRTPALAAALAPVTRHPDYQARMKAAVAAGNARLARVERVRRFHIIERDFSQEAGELTPTMKLKRKAVEAAYAEIFDRIYDEDGFALEP